MITQNDMHNCRLGVCNSFNDKNILISMSLLMRLFEFMHEEAKDDVSMHNVMEKIISLNDGKNPLTMNIYEYLVSNVETKDGEYSTNEDIDDSYELGRCCADIGCDMETVDYSDVGKIIKQCKDNGYGASNSELESFWKGYEETPLTKPTVINIMKKEDTTQCPEEEIEDELQKQIEEILSNC